MGGPILHVITTVFNPAGYASRYRLYREFAERMNTPGVQFHTVELAIADKPFAVTEEGHPRHVRVRTPQALWYKENLVNLGIRRLPEDWEYVAWIDADVQFARPDWAQETIAQLQKHPVVQMFSLLANLGPNYHPLRMHPGFVYARAQSREGSLAARGANMPAWGEPGFAWAARRQEIEAVGGILDWAIVGSGDALMSRALTGETTRELEIKLSPASQKALDRYQQKCTTHIRGNLGYVEGMISHFWHGSRANRAYKARAQILIDNAYDPATDLQRDADGLIHLSAKKPKLARQIIAYFSSRDEDSLDTLSERRNAEQAPSLQA
jgi:hypothetical protein